MTILVENTKDKDNNMFKLLIAKASDYGNGRITHSGSAETLELKECFSSL